MCRPPMFWCYFGIGSFLPRPSLDLAVTSFTRVPYSGLRLRAYLRSPYRPPLSPVNRAANISPRNSCTSFSVVATSYCFPQFLLSYAIISTTCESKKLFPVSGIPCLSDNLFRAATYGGPWQLPMWCSLLSTQPGHRVHSLSALSLLLDLGNCFNRCPCACRFSTLCIRVL